MRSRLQGVVWSPADSTYLTRSRFQQPTRGRFLKARDCATSSTYSALRPWASFFKRTAQRQRSPPRGTEKWLLELITVVHELAPAGNPHNGMDIASPRFRLSSNWWAKSVDMSPEKLLVLWYPPWDNILESWSLLGPSLKQLTVFSLLATHLVPGEGSDAG
jgi:hypothetical protein